MLLSRIFYFLVVITISTVSCVNLAYFKMYDIDNNQGEISAMDFNHSQPHLSNDFQRVMANTHKICTNGIWRLFPGSSYTLIGSAAVDYSAGFGLGSSTSYETCRVLSQSEAFSLSKMGSLRRVGPANLEEISLRTYTGPYYSGIESVIDGEKMEDQNLRGYMDSFVITGPRNQHPDNASAFISAFQFFQRYRYTGEQTCIIMRNDQHGNHIPRKGAAFSSSVYEKMVVDGDMVHRFGSVKLIPYSDAFYVNICPTNTTIYVPEETHLPAKDYGYSSVGYGERSGYSSSNKYAEYQSSSYQPAYSPKESSYEAPSYSPSYQPAAPAYSYPSYQPPSYSSSYQPASYNSGYQPYSPDYDSPSSDLRY